MEIEKLKEVIKKKIPKCKERDIYLDTLIMQNILSKTELQNRIAVINRFFHKDKIYLCIKNGKGIKNRKYKCIDSRTLQLMNENDRCYKHSDVIFLGIDDIKSFKEIKKD